MRETFQNTPGASWNGEITWWARSLPSLTLAGSLLSGTSPSDNPSLFKCWITCLQAGRHGLGPEPSSLAFVPVRGYSGGSGGGDGAKAFWELLWLLSRELRMLGSARSLTLWGGLLVFFPRHLWLSGFPSPFTCGVRVGSATQGFSAYLVTALWCWERLRAGGEGGDRGWNDWMASMTQWTWVWANSRGWWKTGKPGVLQSVGLQRVRHNWVTKLNWII